MGGGAKRKSSQTQSLERKIGYRLSMGVFLKAFLAITFFFFFLNRSHHCVDVINSVVFISPVTKGMISSVQLVHYTGTIPKIASQSGSNIVVICSLY